METIAGIFRQCETARAAIGALRHSGFPIAQVNLFCPGSPGEERIRTVPTSPTEQPGMGGAMGGVLGGALGLAGGFELGIGATALIPGVGPVLAFGIAGAALLGAGGAVGGALLGEAAEAGTTEGIPSDELFFYEDALRQGRSLALVFSHSHAETRKAREVLGEAGAESLDAARHEWWLGLRDAEAEHYRALGHNFEADQDAYRAGFESALRRECRGNSLEESSDCLKWWYPDTWDSDAFRRGYARGQAYRERQTREEVREDR